MESLKWEMDDVRKYRKPKPAMLVDFTIRMSFYRLYGW